MSVLEALMATAMFCNPSPNYQCINPNNCVFVTETGSMQCKKVVDLGGLVPNVFDPDAKRVQTTVEFGPMPGMIPGAAPILSPELMRPRNFADELATIPGAFDGAMPADKPGLADLAKPTTEGTAPR